VYEALQARALVLGMDQPGGTSSVDAAGEALASVIGPDLTVVELRGGGRPSLVHGAVLAWGAPPGTPARAPEWIGPIQEGAARVGLPVRSWDGSPEVACCSDLRYGWRDRLARLGRDRQASLFLSTSLRERRFGPVGLEAAVAQAVHLGIPRLAGTLPQVLAGADRSARSDAPYDPHTFQLLRRYAERRHAGDLGQLARHPGIRVLVDDVTGEAFLIYLSRWGRSLGVVSLRDPGPHQAVALELGHDEAVPADALARLRHGALTALLRRGGREGPAAGGSP
jgi:hypothetical protein